MAFDVVAVVLSVGACVTMVMALVIHAIDGHYCAWWTLSVIHSIQWNIYVALIVISGAQ